MKKYFFVLFFSFFFYISFSQNNNDSLRFAYNGTDAKISRIRGDNMYLASLGISYMEYEAYNYYFPLLWTISGEFGRRVIYAGKFCSISFNATPHIGFSHLFVGKLAGTANLNLFNYAHYDNRDNFGLFVGGGYEALLSTLGNSGVYPIARTGFLIDNFRITFQTALDQKSNSKYTILFSSKLDW